MKKTLALLTLAYCAHLTADIAYVANAGNGTVTVFDTVTSTIIGSPIAVGTTPLSVAITPDGSRVYVTNNSSNSVSVIDTTTNSVIATITGVGTLPNTIAIAPNGKKAYVSSPANNSVSVIDIESNTVIGTPIPTGVNPSAIVISPDGTRAFVRNNTGSTPTTISVIDTATDANINTIFIPAAAGSFQTGSVNGIAITPDGRFIYTITAVQSTIHFIDAKAETYIGSIPISETSLSEGVIVSLDGTKLYVVNSSTPQAVVISTATHLVETIITTPNGGFGLATSSDGSAVFTTNATSPGSVVGISTTTDALFGPTVTVGDTPIGIALKGVQPPRSVQVKQTSNKYGVISEFFNYLSWERSPSLSLAGYEIRRNGTLIKTLGPNALSFKDHNQSSSKTDTYTVTAFDATGVTSFPVTVIAQGN